MGRIFGIYEWKKNGAVLFNLLLEMMLDPLLHINLIACKDFKLGARVKALPSFISSGTIQIRIVPMADIGTNSNKLIEHIIKNSLFTPNQCHIISKLLAGAGRAENMTPGSYYRQVRQCRDKVSGLLYSILLLEALGALDPQAAIAISKMADQIRVILSHGTRDIITRDMEKSVMSVISQLVKSMSKL